MTLIRGNWETPLGSVTKLPIPLVERTSTLLGGVEHICIRNQVLKGLETPFFFLLMFNIV